jgi:hypothetical protein
VQVGMFTVLTMWAIGHLTPLYKLQKNECLRRPIRGPFALKGGHSGLELSLRGKMGNKGVFLKNSENEKIFPSRCAT